MAETVRKVEYYYVTVPNRPGEGARVLDALRDAGVNLVAFHAFPAGRRAQLDFVPEDPRALKAAARKAKLPLSPRKTAFLIEGDDRPGAVADLLDKLAAAGVSVPAKLFHAPHRPAPPGTVSRARGRVVRPPSPRELAEVTP